MRIERFLILGLLIPGCSNPYQSQNSAARTSAHDAYVRSLDEKYEEQLRKADEQDRRYDAQLDGWDKQIKRLDMLLDTWEQQTSRVDALLSRWENAAPTGP